MSLLPALETPRQKADFMRVAIVHHWFVGYRGGEKVIENMLELYPDADLFTLFWEPDKLPEVFRRRKVTTSFLNRFSIFKRNHRLALPLMPLALEQLDVRGYDLVISSESGPAKAVLADPEAVHICYINSPMRYIWDMYHEYRQSMGWLQRMFFTPLAHYLRRWDRSTSMGVDHFVANSSFVAKRVHRCYHRDSTVVHPPVDMDMFAPSGKNGDYFFAIAEMVPYKRMDLAVQAFRGLDAKLKMAGSGPDLGKLRAMAPPNVEFLGRVDDDRLRTLYAEARAFIFPGKEDFGITPLEANASGTPVIAYRAGGILDTQTDETAVFFDEQTPEAVAAAVRTFMEREGGFSADALRANAARFSRDEFKRRFKAVVDGVF
ncbi:glycosyl transferase [bacterium CG17_big_fil_post_rev_8_21_14_2_50_64_8]|nr:MAG: glycosyl transferase [bacterium CG17_big_fil_post_rev_8_21_14_2_50_64_8]PJA76616.1 MAG: glycosyl transferase [bacterium CG_4_9_14_3_um_filter_65_15]